MSWHSLQLGQRGVRTERCEAALLRSRRVERAYACVDPDGVGPRLFFQRVPEGKTVKNRVHLDVDVPDLEVAANAAEALGAERVGDVVYDELGGFQVMADPEGNEFCFIHGPTAITA
mgnify:CR=1 FL=1